MSEPPSAHPVPTSAVPTAADRSQTNTGWRSARTGFSPLAESVAKLATPMLGRRGLVEGRLMIEWPLIVGERIAARTQPERFAGRRRGEGGGTLQVRVASGAMALELQHGAPQLIERINSYFGYCAVGRLRLVRAPLHGVPVAPPPPPPPAPETEAKVDAAVADIEDLRLKQVLAALGRHMLAPLPRSGR